MRRLALAALFLAGAIAAQERAVRVQVVVHVVADGAPLPGAEVVLRATDGTEKTGIADEAGVVRFSVAPGEYEVRVSVSGFSSRRATLTAAPGAEASLTVSLRRSPGAVSVEPPTPPPEPSRPAAAPPPPVAAAPPPPMAPPPPAPTVSEVPVSAPTVVPMVDVSREADHAVVQVYYATDRAFTGETAPAKLFGGARGHLSLGIAHVSIPRDHHMGELEHPSIWKLEFSQDPSRDVVLLSVKPQLASDYYGKLSRSVQQSKNRETFVFVHGYNVTFEDAARRVAQIKYDIAFDGPAILYSWPSAGSTDHYLSDRENAEWASGDLLHFLTDVAAKSGARSIHLVAHSMGNRVLANALLQMQNVPNHPRFTQIVLAAPDIDADTFKRQLAPAMVAMSKHVTLYASSNDKALLASKTVAGAPRAGEAGAAIVVVNGIDTIDASDVDSSFLGHSYIAESRTILSDVYCLIRGAADASQRCRLARKGSYWKFVAAAEQVSSLVNYHCSAASCMIRTPPP